MKLPATLFPLIALIAFGPQLAEARIGLSAPQTLLAQQDRPNIATYTWPDERPVVPLEAEIRTEEYDGFPETSAVFTSGNFQFYFRISSGLSVASNREGTSSRLVNRLMPENSLDLYLFQAGAFLPAVNDTTLHGYQLGLKEQHEEDIVIDEEADRIPRKTFSVLGNQWGLIRYTLVEDGKENAFVEYFVPLPGHLLVLRLRGTDSFVTGMMPRVTRSLSTLAMGEP